MSTQSNNIPSYANKNTLISQESQAANYKSNNNDINVNKTYTIKFKSNKKFPDQFSDYFYLQDYIDEIKPNNNLSAAFINAKGELILKTIDESKLEYLKAWPNNAFVHGIMEISNQRKYYLALHNVEIKFDVESDRCKNFLKEKYDIDNVLRMIKKSTGLKLPLVKAVTSNKDKFNQVINEGFIRIGHSQIRTSAWKFEPMPIQCFNCQGLGHKSDTCKKEQTCMRCSKKNDHTYKTCPVKDPSLYKCTNCQGNHASCSKSCPKIIEALNKMSEKQAQTMSHKTNQFTRIESASTSHNATNKAHYRSDQPQTYNMLKFIIELFRNFRQISA